MPDRVNEAISNLPYFVEWRTKLWGPIVRWLIDDPKRFAGKKVLELGCGSGRMSCLFGLLGANVTGLEIEGMSLENARNEIEYWGLSDQIRLLSYNGSPANISDDHYDFVFTKSVLVIIPQLEKFLKELAEKMSPDGELLAAENLPLAMFLHNSRMSLNNLVRNHRWNAACFKRTGVGRSFLQKLTDSFEIVDLRNHYGLIAAIRARKNLAQD